MGGEGSVIITSIFLYPGGVSARLGPCTGFSAFSMPYFIIKTYPTPLSDIVHRPSDTIPTRTGDPIRFG